MALSRLLVLLLYVAVEYGHPAASSTAADGHPAWDITPGGAGSALIWGYVIGPIGMLLAVAPLTMIANCPWTHRRNPRPAS